MNNGDMPASPQSGKYEGNDLPSTSADFGGSGLTKREAFAMAAMQGLCANPNVVKIEDVYEEMESSAIWLIPAAYALADKALEE